MSLTLFIACLVALDLFLARPEQIGPWPDFLTTFHLFLHELLVHVNMFIRCYLRN